MGLLTKWFGSREEKSHETLRDIAKKLGIEDKDMNLADSTLQASWQGGTLHLRYRDGTASNCRFTHPPLKDKVWLEHDPAEKKRSLTPPGAPQSKAHLGAGLVCESEDRDNYERWPLSLRNRVATTLEKSSVRYLRCGVDETSLEFATDSDESTAPAHIVSALGLALEICRARGLRPSKPRKRASFVPLTVAQEFAKRVPGAQVEDLAEKPFSGIWARVNFAHDGTKMRLVFYRFDRETCNVWLEARAEKKLGAFGLMRLDDDEATSMGELDDDGEVEAPSDPPQTEASEEGEEDHDEEGEGVRIFLAKTCYVGGAKARTEAARISSLPEKARELVLRLCSEHEAVVLAEEVLSLHIGELSSFVERGVSERGALPYPIALGVDLAAVAAALPVQSKELAQLAELRTCRFCRTTFVFAPQTPVCVSCGAPSDRTTDAESTLKTLP